MVVHGPWFSVQVLSISLPHNHLFFHHLLHQEQSALNLSRTAVEPCSDGVFRETRPISNSAYAGRAVEGVPGRAPGHGINPRLARPRPTTPPADAGRSHHRGLRPDRKSTRL